MIVRVWFRRDGRQDGLWWTLDVEGVEHHASIITGQAAFATEAMPGPEPETPLHERRHVVRFEVECIDWLGSVAVLNPVKRVVGEPTHET